MNKSHLAKLKNDLEAKKSANTITQEELQLLAEIKGLFVFDYMFKKKPYSQPKKSAFMLGVSPNKCPTCGRKF